MPKKPEGLRKSSYEHIENQKLGKLYAQNTIWREKNVLSIYKT